MSGPFLRFEDGKISLNNKDLIVQSANLSIAPSLNIERVYGDYDPDIAGAKIDFVQFSPSSNLKGTLDISFFISADTHSFNNGNTIDRLFDIRAGMSEKPIHTNKVGRYFFDNMYLTSFSFSLKPFSIIEARASYDIYGTIQKENSNFFRKTEIDFAHGLTSFGEMKASNSVVDSAIDTSFEITNLSYNILVNRNIYNSVRASEHSSVNTRASGVVPTRVSIDSIEAEMQITTNQMIPNLNSYGDYQSGNSIKNSDSEVSANIYSLEGNKMAEFVCVGKIISQSSSISKGSASTSTISVKQVIK